MRLKLLFVLGLLSACADNSTGDDATAAAGARSDAVAGEAAYQAYCETCHQHGITTDGLGSAPIVGNVASWGDSAELPLEVLTARAREGHRGMPERASRPDLPDETVNAAVAYMLSATFPDRPLDQ